MGGRRWRYLHDAFGEVRKKQVGLVTFTLAMLYWFVVEESVQLHRLVRRRTVLVLRHDQSRSSHQFGADTSD